MSALHVTTWSTSVNQFHDCDKLNAYQLLGPVEKIVVHQTLDD